MLSHPRPTYHGEIGREATADAMSDGDEVETYHGEISREATAHQYRGLGLQETYHGEIGREATAKFQSLPV